VNYPTEEEKNEMMEDMDRMEIQRLVNEAKRTIPERCAHCGKHVNIAIYDFERRCCNDCGIEERMERDN
jgi:predicted Zn-dependent protease with MMP-like domain